MTCRDCVDTVVVGHLPEQANGQKRLRTPSDGLVDCIDIDIERRRIDIDEDRLGSDQCDRFCAADPREWDRDHLVTGAYPERAQRNFQTVGPTCDRYAVPYADITGERFL